MNTEGVGNVAVKWLWAALGLVLFIASACGGSSAGGVAVSSDGVLSVDQPASGGISVVVESADNPSEVAELAGDDFWLFTYELSPDGSVFDEPLAVEVHLSPEDLGLSEMVGVHPVFLVSEGTSGFIFLPADIAIEDGDLVARGEVSHFSKLTVAVARQTIELSTTPGGDPIKVAEGEDIYATVTASWPISEDPGRNAFFPEFAFAANSPITFDSSSESADGREVDGIFHCAFERDEVILDAITFNMKWNAKITPRDDDVGIFIEIFQYIMSPESLVDDAGHGTATLSADVLCSADAPEPTAGTSSPTTSSTEPPPNSDPEGDQTDESISQPLQSGDLGEPATDIVHVSHMPVAGGQSFQIQMAGDGPALVSSPGFQWLDMFLTVTMADGSIWEVNMSFFGSEAEYRQGSGPDGDLDGVTATALWVSPDTLELVITFEGEVLDVETFEFFTLVRTGDGTYGDHAEGVAGSE